MNYAVNVQRAQWHSPTKLYNKKKMFSFDESNINYEQKHKYRDGVSDISG